MGKSIATKVEDVKESDDGLLQQYLSRLCYKADEINAVLASKPSFDLVADLLERHGKYIPFENLDQHVHPAGDSCKKVDKVWGLTETDGHARIKNPEKIIRKYLKGRGGFCFEQNTTMHWLLAKLGFNVRMSLSKVWFEGKFFPPTHCCNLVTLDDSIWLVDPGFGALLVPVPLNGKVVRDATGDLLRISKSNEGDGYDLALWRKRVIPTINRFSGDKIAGNDEEQFTCQHTFRPTDDLLYGNKEFCSGLTMILTHEQSPFIKGRICSKLTENGRVSLVKNRIKWTVGKEIVQKELRNEDEARAALLEYFDLRLGE